MHIHGDVDDIVVGCGEESFNSLLKEVRTMKNHPAFIAISKFAHNTIKPVKSLIMERLIPFLDKFQFDDCLEIYVLGHSKNEIDKEYFSFINQRFRNSIWKFSVFDSKDNATTDLFVKKLGIDKYLKSSIESLLDELRK